MGWALPEITVAVVTALPVECAAMRAVVEDPRPWDPRSWRSATTDPNHYVNGFLPSTDPAQPHGVAVVMLPRDGTRDAAAVCTDVIHTFPGVRLIMMAGVAGGVPAPENPPSHVRLGDVVVATDGIVDYGHVRSENGTETPRRQLTGLSYDAVRAARELQVKAINGVRPWETWLTATADRVGAGFARPDDATDVLHWHGRMHPHPSRDSSGHRPRMPKVHYGPIASGDRLLRDAALRDEIAARFHVLAVEMEASGIAVAAAQHGREWMVVRGVVDYCDHLKRDGWHPYASLVAAAYVRALMGECRPLVPAPAPPAGYGGHSGPVLDEPPWRPTGPVLMHLVDLLLQVPLMGEERGRQEVVEQLRASIRGAIRRHPASRLDVTGIMRACLDHPGGTAELAAAIMSLDGDSIPARRFIHELWSYMASTEGTPRLPADGTRTRPGLGTHPR
jgi:nucleoside phosphorylase